MNRAVALNQLRAHKATMAHRFGVVDLALFSALPMTKLRMPTIPHTPKPSSVQALAHWSGSVQSPGCGCYHCDRVIGYDSAPPAARARP